MTPPDARTSADILGTWIAAIAFFAYLRHLHRERMGSSLGGRTLFLLYCAGSLFLFRGFYWFDERNAFLGKLTFVPCSLIPLALALFVEGMVRRHLHLALKLYVAGGTVLFASLNLVGNLPTAVELLLPFLIFMVSVPLTLAVLVLARDRRDLTAAENRFLDSVLVGGLLLVPLVVTDFRTTFDWIPTPRMGGIAGLLFVHASVRPADRSDSMAVYAREIGTIFSRGAVAAIALVAVTGHFTVASLLDAFSFSLSIVLLIILLERLKVLRLENRETSFLRWLLRADMTSTETLIHSLRELPLTEEHLTLGKGELDGYDLPAILRLFEARDCVLNLAALRAEKAAASRAAPEAVEELIDLLEKHAMTHATLIRHEPFTLLFLNLPRAGNSRVADLQVELVRKYARLLDRSSASLV